MPAKKKPVTRVVAIRVPYAVHKALEEWVKANPKRKRKIGKRARAMWQKQDPELPWDVETMAEDIEIFPPVPQTEATAPEGVTPE